MESLEERAMLAIDPILLADIGLSSNSITEITEVGGKLFFVAANSTNGQEFWKSDGASAGTVLVKDINPGVGDSSPRKLTAVGNTLFFNAHDSVHGRELWLLPVVKSLIVSINPTSISENGGTATGTVTRSNANNSAALTVNLSSNDTTEATVPASVIIPAGAASVISRFHAASVCRRQRRRRGRYFRPVGSDFHPLKRE